MPNVVLLMSDEHNPFISSLYGHPEVETPNMERLAKLGTNYENAYCNSPLCFPSRSSFMAGKPVHQLQTYNNCNVLPHDYVAYGKVLHDQGVHTVHIGKTDVWEQPDALGFSEMMRAQGRKRPGDINFRRKPLTERAGAHKRAKGYGPKKDAFKGPEAAIDLGINWIKEQAAQLHKPWVLSLNIGPPHFPHFVTEALWEKYVHAADLPKYGAETAAGQHPYAQDLRKHFQMADFSEEDIRGLRRGYLGCVTWVDQQIGRLLDTLEETGRLQDTVFIYTSDHGEMLGKHGLWWKCSLYEDSVRIPMIAAGPGFTAGRRETTPVTLLDLQAAIFDAVGKHRPYDWHGKPLQHMPADSPDRAVLSEYHGHGTRSSAYMVRKGKWKLIYNMEAPHQLFNLEADPDELVNLAEAEPKVFAEMEQTLRGFCSPEKETDRSFAWEERQLAAIAELGK